MFKQALYTYWKSLHPRNLKFIKDKYWTTFIILFVLLPDYTEVKRDGIAAFYTVTIFLPIAIMKISNLVYKLKVPKALFLVPMKEKDRENYVKCLLGIKIGASMLLGFVIQCIWGLYYEIPFVEMLAILFSYLSYGIADYICVEGNFGGGSKIEHGVRTASGVIAYSSCNLINIVAVWFVLWICAPQRLDEALLHDVALTPAMQVAVILMLILDIIIIIRSYRDMMKCICDYEENFLFENKGETIEKQLKLKY